MTPLGVYVDQKSLVFPGLIEIKISRFDIHDSYNAIEFMLQEWLDACLSCWSMFSQKESK